MERKFKIAPSILSADFNELRYEISRCEDCGCDYLHFDVMDGHFVPNISFGIPVLAKVSRSHHMINDVHLMITNPSYFIEPFAKAGADIITFHYEACKNDREVFEIIDKIHRFGCKAGLSVKPLTPVEKVFPFLNSLELVLIMTVEPGFGGQKFDKDCLTKILRLKEHLINMDNSHVEIEVDGGINAETGKVCRECGADVLVAGSYIFSGSEIYERVESLKK